MERDMEQVDHPSHYGGEGSTYEAIKVIEDLGLGYGFCLGNALKYISRADHKGSREVDLKKSLWYLKRCVEQGHYGGSVRSGARFSGSDVTTGWRLQGRLLMAVQLVYAGNIPGAVKELETEIRMSGDAG